jgi:hypothetical protein
MRGHRAALAEWWEVMERWRTSPDYRADLDYGVISSQSLLDDIAARELRDARRDIQRRCQPTPDFPHNSTRASRRPSRTRRCSADAAAGASSIVTRPP